MGDKGDPVTVRSAGGAREPSWLARAIPIVDWLPHYRRAWLPRDLIAGVTVWAVLIPESIAYASIAGVPVQYGLYTALGAATVFALFTRTRQVITGPSGPIAAVAASVCTLIVAADSPKYLAAMVGLCVATAIVYLLLGVFRMGWVSNFLASPVLEGFVFAFGLGLIADQLHKLLGIPKVDGSYWEKLVGAVKDLPQTDLYTLAVGGTAVVLLLAMRSFAPRLPRAIIVVILGTIAVPLFGLKSHGVAVVGDLPSGLPSLTLPTGLSLEQWGGLLVGSLAVVFVGFSESIAAVSAMAAKHGGDFSTDQELVALGGAHVGSALLGGFPVSGSLSKTSVADGAGQKTQLSLLVVSALTVVTLLFLTGLFATLPEAVLGAIVIDAAVGLLHWRVPARFWVVGKRAFAVFVVTGIGLFFIGVVAGVIIGVVLSLLLLIAAASRSPVRRMAYDERERAWVEARSHPEAAEDEEVLVAAILGPLFFADAAACKARILRMARESGASVVVLDLGTTPEIDIDGADTLTKVAGQLRSNGVRLLLARVDGERLDLLRRAGTLKAIGDENLFVTVRDAVSATPRRSDGDTPSD
jgi:sulfate permease, SulP family